MLAGGVGLRPVSGMQHQGRAGGGRHDRRAGRRRQLPHRHGRRRGLLGGYRPVRFGRRAQCRAALESRRCKNAWPTMRSAPSRTEGVGNPDRLDPRPRRGRPLELPLRELVEATGGTDRAWMPAAGGRPDALVRRRSSATSRQERMGLVVDGKKTVQLRQKVSPSASAVAVVRGGRGDGRHAVHASSSQRTGRAADRPAARGHVRFKAAASTVLDGPDGPRMRFA